MIIICILLVIVLGISLYYNYKHGMLLLDIQDSLEICLDVIDEKYESMSEILARPLFYDSPEVRKVVDDIRGTRSSLHKMAISLSSNFEAEDEDKNDNAR